MSKASRGEKFKAKCKALEAKGAQLQEYFPAKFRATYLLNNRVEVVAV